MTRFVTTYGVLALFLLICGGFKPVLAQVFEVGGGTSSLYQAGGGSLTMHSKGFDMTIGAGTADGHLLEGGRILKSTRNGTYIFGDDRIDFRLPTDVFDSSHYLLARGAGFSGVRRDIDIVAFGGAMSVEYDSPFFNGAKSSSPAGILFLKDKLNSKWRIYSDTVISKKFTEIVSAAWAPAPKTEIAFSGGLGANQPFGAASLTMERPIFDLRAAYILAGEQFHRAATASPEMAEPTKENVLITVRPLNFLSVTASHQNYLDPVSAASFNAGNTVNATSSIDEGSLSLHFWKTQMNGTVYRGTYQEAGLSEESNHSAAASISRDFLHRIHWNSLYLVSKPRGGNGTSSATTTFTEELNSRLSVTENLTYSGGRPGVNFGGEFLSNVLTVSASYDTFYVPANNDQPFEQALLVDVKFKVLGRMLLHGASFVDPTGHLRYTAEANSVLSHERISHPLERVSLGNYVLHGCVLDEQGVPVEGAAVVIDQAPLYTDSNGCFNLRENSPRPHQLRVVISEFLMGGNWQVVTTPTSVMSTTEDRSEEMRVIVVVRRVREISTNSDQPPRLPQGAESR